MSTDLDVLVAHDIIDNIERDFLEQDKMHLVLHFDPIVTGDKAVNDARTFVARQVKTIDERLTIHDLRIVDGPTHTNYVFDVVAPPEFGMADKELCEKIEKAVQRGEKPVHAVITVDHSYAPVNG
jgi:divalent metal cation (Fe/Co/Zn/Cd) transporter